MPQIKWLKNVLLDNREQICGCQGGGGGWGGKDLELWISKCKLLRIEWINNKPSGSEVKNQLAMQELQETWV